MHFKPMSFEKSMQIEASVFLKSIVASNAIRPELRETHIWLMSYQAKLIDGTWTYT